MLTSEQIDYAVAKKTFLVQFIKLDFTSPQTHVFQGDSNWGITHVITEMTNKPFSSVQLDLGYTTSSWFDVDMADMVNFAAAFLAMWGPDVDSAWP